MMTFFNRFLTSSFWIVLLAIGFTACQSDKKQPSQEEQSSSNETMQAYERQIQKLENAVLGQDSTLSLDYFRQEVRETRNMIEQDRENYSQEMQESIAVLDQRWTDALARWEARLVDTDYFQIRKNIEAYIAQVRDSVQEGAVQEWAPIKDQFEEEIQRMEAAADSVSISTLTDDRQALQGRFEMVRERWKKSSDTPKY